MCFKELNGQKRNFSNRIYSAGADLKRIYILAIHLVLLILEPKKFKCHPVKAIEGSLEDLIFPVRYFRCVIQRIIIKFDFQNTKMRNTVLFSIIILLLFSCKKNKYTTKPQLKYKSVNGKVFRSGDIITFTLSFTDAEGDLISDSALYVRKFEPRCPASNFAQYYPLPKDFTPGKDQAGEISVTYGYNNSSVPQQILGPRCARNDTCVFKFVLRDKEKNRSDTVTSEAIVLIR